MQIPQLDRSNYLKGLLITARKDEQLTDSEKNMIRKLSERLGFSLDFFEETINNLLERLNKPGVFKTLNTAKLKKKWTIPSLNNNKCSIENV